MNEDEKKELLSLAGEGLRRAAQEGSKLEKYLLVGLQESGHEARFHERAWNTVEDLEVDIVIPTIKVAIEIDGPSHYLPIWGEEKLIQVMAADARKTGLLIQCGYRVIRIKCLLKNISDYQMRVALEELMDVLESIETDPKDFYEIELK